MPESSHVLARCIMRVLPIFIFWAALSCEHRCPLWAASSFMRKPPSVSRSDFVAHLELVMRCPHDCASMWRLSVMSACHRFRWYILWAILIGRFQFFGGLGVALHAHGSAEGMGCLRRFVLRAIFSRQPRAYGVLELDPGGIAHPGVCLKKWTCCASRLWREFLFSASRRLSVVAGVVVDFSFFASVNPGPLGGVLVNVKHK